MRRKGIAEVPPSEGTRYVINTAGLGDLIFNDRGELYIDRRFVTKEDMKNIKAIERRSGFYAALPPPRGVDHAGMQR